MHRQLKHSSCQERVNLPCVWFRDEVLDGSIPVFWDGSIPVSCLVARDGICFVFRSRSEMWDESSDMWGMFVILCFLNFLLPSHVALPSHLTAFWTAPPPPRSCKHALRTLNMCPTAQPRYRHGSLSRSRAQPRSLP